MEKKLIIGILAVIVVTGGVIFGVIRTKHAPENNNETSSNNDLKSSEETKSTEEVSGQKEELKEPEVSEYTLNKTDLTQYLEKDITTVADELGLKQLKRSYLSQLSNVDGYYSKRELGEDLIVGDSDGDGKVDYLEISLQLGGDSYRIYTLVPQAKTETLDERLEYIGYKNVIENPTEQGVLGGTYDYKYELNNGYNIFLGINPDNIELTRTVILMK